MTLPLRRLGRDGPHVSAIDLGGMALSYAERPSERDAVALMHALFERGVARRPC